MARKLKLVKDTAGRLVTADVDQLIAVIAQKDGKVYLPDLKKSETVMVIDAFQDECSIYTTRDQVLDLVHDLAESTMIRKIDGHEYLMHIHDAQFGYNRPRNNGLPTGVKLKDLEPGRKVQVRFPDRDSVAIIIQLESPRFGSTTFHDLHILEEPQGPKLKARYYVVGLNQVIRLDGSAFD